MKSIRRQVTVWLIATIVGLVGLFGVGLYVYVRHVLVGQFDDALLEQAVALRSVTMLEADGRIDFELNPDTTPHYKPSASPHYFHVWHATGQSLARSPSLQGHDLRPTIGDASPSFRDMALPDGRSGRVVQMSYTPLIEMVWSKPDSPTPNQQPAPGLLRPPTMTVVVARERESLDGTLTTILAFFATGTLAIAGGAALIVSLIVARGVQPLQRLAGEVEAIRPDALQRRFPTAGLPDELQPIVEKLNGLLERVDATVRRERRFTADAAHELRTPVAELRALTDVAGAWRTENPAVNQALRDTREIAIHMEALITALLDLSRQGSGALTVRPQSVDLCLVLMDVHKGLQSRATGKSVSVGMTLPSTASVSTDPLFARACIHNLMDNAIKHSPSGAQVACDLCITDEGLVLSLINPCSGLSEEDLTHVGEPFWRKDAARSDGEHFGLGVALVKAYAGAMSAELSLELAAGERFVAKLRFPPSAPANGGADPRPSDPSSLR